MGYWFQCRYQFSKERFEMMRVQEMLRKRALLDGVEDPTVIGKIDADIVEV